MIFLGNGETSMAQVAELFLDLAKAIELLGAIQQPNMSTDKEMTINEKIELNSMELEVVNIASKLYEALAIKPEKKEVKDATKLPKIIITQDNCGRFECVKENKMGSAIVGRGASVTEAVGDYIINNSNVVVICKPPALLREYSIKTPYLELRFSSSPERD